MNYLVTGSEGFIGTHLRDALYTRGHEFHGIDVRAEGREDVDISCDDLDFSAYDGVFHLAAVAGVLSYGRVFEHYARANVLGTQRVFEACAEAGVRCVFVSSSSVYGRPDEVPTPESAPLRPLSPYGITKLTGEHLARAYASERGLDVTVLRYFTVYGPGQRPDMLFAKAIEAVKTGEPLHFRGAGCSRGFTYVDDIVEATVRAMASDTTATFNVGGGEEVDVTTALRYIAELAGENVPYIEEAPAPGEETRTQADVTKAGFLLDWKPTVGIEEGLRRQWEASCSEST